LQTELTLPQAISLEAGLASIDRAARALLMRHSDLFHSVNGLISRTRTDLATRLIEIRSQTAKQKPRGIDPGLSEIQNHITT
jgi:hypothetical protein